MRADHSERMWQMAYDLARSGGFPSARDVGVALQSRGYPQAPQILDNKRIRDELDRLCTEANAVTISVLKTEGALERSRFSEPQSRS